MKYSIHLVLLFATTSCLGPSWRPPWEPRHGPPQFAYSGYVPKSSSGPATELSSYYGAIGAVATTVVAASANRAVFRTCYASCLAGTACDSETGQCVPLPCRGRCPGGTTCRMVDGEETCTRGERDAMAPEPPTTVPPPSAAAGTPSPEKSACSSCRAETAPGGAH
jgi:hypothetical protein